MKSIKFKKYNFLRKCVIGAYLAKRFPDTIKYAGKIQSISYTIEKIIGKKKFKKYFDNLKKKAYGQLESNRQFILEHLEYKYQELLKGN